MSLSEDLANDNQKPRIKLTTIDYNRGFSADIKFNKEAEMKNALVLSHEEGELLNNSPQQTCWPPR